VRLLNQAAFHHISKERKTYLGLKKHLRLEPLLSLSLQLPLLLVLVLPLLSPPLSSLGGGGGR
jgi:hypothetical protein